MEEILWHGQPRIAVNGGSGTRRDNRPSSLTIMPYMMMPGDDKIAAAAIRKLLANPPHIAVPEPEPAGVDVAGEWVADLTFISGSSRHHFTIEQHEGKLSGVHRGDILVREADRRGGGPPRHHAQRAAHRRRHAALRILGRCGGRPNGRRREVGRVRAGADGPRNGLEAMIRIIAMEREYGAGGSAIARKSWPST